MVVPSVVVSPLVVPEPPLEVLVVEAVEAVEAVWSPVPVEPPAPVVTLPVLVAPSVLVPAAVPAPATVALPVTEPVVPEPVVLAPELVRLLVESCGDVEGDPEPQAATKNTKGTTVIDRDALFISPLPFRMDATGRHRSMGAKR